MRVFSCESHFILTCENQSEVLYLEPYNDVFAPSLET